jgi:hypothetical protein
MNRRDQREDKLPQVVMTERRTQRRAELSSTDVMAILRKRAAEAGRKRSGIEVQSDETAKRSGNM